MPAPAAFYVMIERVVGQVGLRADVPLEGGWIPFQHFVPLTEPRQLVRRTPPKSFRVLLALLDPLLNYRGDQVVRRRRCVLSNCFPGHSISFNPFNCGTHNKKTPSTLNCCPK